MKIIYAGHHNWGVNTLELLLEQGKNIIGILVDYKQIYKNPWFKSVEECAVKNNLPVYKPQNVNAPEFVETIKKLNPDLLVNVSYHQIYKSDFLNLFSSGAINIHAGMLPKYRGRAVMNWVIINGEKEIGITVHYMNPEIDAGDIILQERVKIDINDNAMDVYEKILPLFPKMILKSVESIENGTVNPVKQDIDKGFYVPKRTPDDSKIDWTKTDIELHNFCRALTDPYPNAFFKCDGKKINVKESKIDQDGKWWIRIEKEKED